MNTNEVQDLVISYIHSSRRQQSIIWPQIRQQYNKILESLVYGSYDKVEALAIAEYQLIMALHKYDDTKNTKFNTYVWSYFKAIPRLIIKQTGYFKYESFYEATLQSDFVVDLPNILTEKEIYILKAYCSGRSSDNRKISEIKQKIKTYLKD